MATNNWGRWGAEDERGALNHLTPEVIKAAAASITTGRVYSLGIPIQGQGVPLLDYRGVPMRLTLQDGTDDGMYASYGAQPGTGAHEDVLVMASHTTSHMDALIHVYEDHKHYNGVPFSEMRALGGAAKLGIEKVGGFAARGVLLDMVAHMGADGWLTPGTMLTAADLQACAAAQGTEVRAGDVVLIRTGHLDMWWDNHAKGEPEGFAQAGIGSDAAEWLASIDVTAVGSDNAAVEVIPFDNNDFLIVHKILLVQAGIYMLEHLDLRAAAADGSYEGIIAVAPLKVTGATGSPINPIFIA
ncbi:MAG: cyclase family protein [Acidimicrobiia bacterium]